MRKIPKTMKLNDIPNCCICDAKPEIIANMLFGNMYYDEFICGLCRELLYGLEDYYNKFWDKFYFLSEVRNIILTIQNDKKILTKAKKIRSQGKYLPNDFIEEIKLIYIKNQNFSEEQF